MSDVLSFEKERGVILLKRYDLSFEKRGCYLLKKREFLYFGTKKVLFVVKDRIDMLERKWFIKY